MVLITWINFNVCLFSWGFLFVCVSFLWHTQEGLSFAVWGAERSTWVAHGGQCGWHVNTHRDAGRQARGLQTLRPWMDFIPCDPLKTCILICGCGVENDDYRNKRKIILRFLLRNHLIFLLPFWGEAFSQHSSATYLGVSGRLSLSDIQSISPVCHLT